MLQHFQFAVTEFYYVFLYTNDSFLLQVSDDNFYHQQFSIENRTGNAARPSNVSSTTYSGTVRGTSRRRNTEERVNRRS